jgi:hypothetical protein
MSRSSVIVTALFMGAAVLAPAAAQAVCVRPWATLKLTAPTLAQLDDLLGDAGCSDDLLAYAGTQHTEESILFLRAVMGGQDKRTIYTKYIPAGAPSQINIPDTTRAPLVAVATRRNWARLDFSQAVNDIRALVARDILRRYYASKP